MKQVIVNIERVDELTAAANLNGTEASVCRWSARRIQCRQHGAGAGDLVSPRPNDISNYVNLDVSEAGYRHLELGPGIRRAPDSGIHSPQTAVELVFQLSQREVGHVNLADLGNDDEAFPVHGECVGLLHIASEDEDQYVARPEPIILVHRAVQHRLETGGSPAKS